MPKPIIYVLGDAVIVCLSAKKKRRRKRAVTARVTWGTPVEKPAKPGSPTP